MRHSLLSMALAGLLFPAFVHADQGDLQPTVQVTASRVAETVDATLADVSVITRAQIDASVARDALDLLRLQAGIDLYRTGGPGAQTSLFLRGTNTNQVLVLIDGVRAASATTGAFALEHLPLDAVERIEIVRGPRASYWGSDAIGGVIQIFTRRLDAPRMTLGYGSYQDAGGSAGIGHWNGGDGFSIQVGARNVGGYSSTNPGICNGPEDPYCIYDPDKDGYRNRNLVVHGAKALGSQRLSGALYRSEGRAEFDQGFSEVTGQTAGLNLEGELTDHWSHRLGLGNTREDIQTPAFGSKYRTRRNSLLWQNEFHLAEQQRLVAGVELVRDEGEALDTFAGTPRYRQNRDNRAVFGGWRGTLGAFDGEVSARHDDNSVFGSATTGSLALGWRANDALRFYASIGQGFRSPTMNELYDPGYGGWFAGNPALQPERSISSELAMEWRLAAGQDLKANLYSTRVHDLISFTGPQNQAENIAHSRIDGAELAWRGELGAWTSEVRYTWEDARDTDTGMALLRRARNKASAQVERRFGERSSAGAELVYASRRPDVGGIELGAYTLLNLRAQHALNAHWRLGVRLENLTDRDYALVNGYNTPGRSAWLQVTWQPSM
ncbi:TonB-dependent receptor domain-containing protein [Dokdonella sp.]|uniref:TonB-dependent receptor domain-containing protein n=1 Tax=Dokdonella sp. TaxID=2291710 RepID=UPI0031C7D8E6|nr:TonB-dependent receptor [Dokdonella sp.]